MTTEEDTIEEEVKMRIVDSEIAMYKNTRYQLEVRHRINKKLGNSEEQLKALEKELENVEKALDELKKIKKDLLVNK